MRTRPGLKILSGIAGVGLLAAAAYFAGNYVYHNQETNELTDEVRRAAGGSFVKLSDGFTHYELAGPGKAERTIVLVHGFSVPYYLWDRTFDPLAKVGFRVLRYDLYGRGFSDRPDVRYDADLFDRQLGELLAALKIEGPVDLAGASLGGPIVVTFADRHPQKVRTISLFDPGYMAGLKPPWSIQTPLVGEYVMCVQIAPALPDAQKEDFLHPERYPDYFARYSAQMRYHGFRRALLSTLRDYFPRDDTQEYARMGKSGKPVLLLWGKADKDVPFETSKDVLRAVPQAEFHPIEDAAHVPYYERPEIVNPILLEFLQKN